jgi:tetratricopeptide (TPR) repeat protein
MADENLLGGVVGREEAEEPDEAGLELGPLDPLAAALAAQGIKDGAGLPPEAADYFRKQSLFVEVQTEHLTEQRRLLLRRLQVQLSHLHLKRYIDLARAGAQTFIMLIAAFVAFGLALMLHDAFTSRSVIVEPFDTPPALAPRGVTGKVLASALLDRLSRLQAAARGTTAKRDIASAWNNDIKVEAPGTGVSIGDLDRLLRQRFGHDVRIDGDLVQTADGNLALSVRGDDVSPRTFTGPAGTLDALTTQAAEYLYGQSQPASYAAYLVNAGRSVEAAAFSKAAFATTDQADRPSLLKNWGDAVEESGGDPRDALALYRQALKLKSDDWVAYGEMMGALAILGDEEGAWRVGEAMRAAAGGRPGRAPEIAYQNWDWLTWNLQAWRAGIVGDAQAYGGVGSAQSDVEPNIADVDVRLHDPASAALHLKLTTGGDPIAAAITLFVSARLASEAGETAQAASRMEAFGAAYANPAVSSSYPGYNCWIAPAEEAAGHPDKADAVLAAGGRFVNCFRFKGDVLDHRSDWRGAQSAYAAAVALAPDLPAGYYSWGLALARHGDLAGAEARLEAAHVRGPHWADPLKAWGDVLVRQGRPADALAKYDEALRYAPAWAELAAARAAVGKH